MFIIFDYHKSLSPLSLLSNSKIHTGWAKYFWCISHGKKKKTKTKTTYCKLWATTLYSFHSSNFQNDLCAQDRVVTKAIIDFLFNRLTSLCFVTVPLFFCYFNHMFKNTTQKCLKETFKHLAIHSLLLILIRVVGGLGPLPATIGWKAECTLDRLPTCVRTHSHTHYGHTHIYGQFRVTS